MINRDETTLYELNAQGVNRWFANVQAGHDDSGNRTTAEELDKITQKLSAVDELYEALEQIVSNWDNAGIPEECFSPEHHAARAALSKARGEV